MTRVLPWLLLGAIACEREVSFDEVATRVVMLPDVLDLGNVPVGGTSTAGMQLEHLSGGPVTIESAVFEGDGADAFEVSELPLLVRSGDKVPVTVTFAPLTAGYALATLRVETTAEASPVLEISTRGRASDSLLRAWPSLLDLGPVPVGDSAAGTVTLENTGGLDLVLDEAMLDAPFTVRTPLPVDLPSGGRATVEVVGTPDDDAPASTTLVLAGDGGRIEIRVRMNDCIQGAPALYDADGDGRTACAGDCDDTRDDVFPGTVEVCDGVDQNCDGTIDEGTRCYDDDQDGRTEDEGDCNDGDPAVADDVPEIPGNGIDDDCDGEVDVEGIDADGDGYGPGAGGDCDDQDPTAYPGAHEIVDGDDEDCDQVADNGTVAFDDDGDGQTEQQGDCDDTRSAVYLGAPETPNGRDDDCDGRVDEGTTRVDDDGDGYSEIGGDCDDNNPNVVTGC